MNLAAIARDMIALRVADAGGKRLSKVSAGIIELCRRDPSPVGLAALAWDYVEEALLVEAPAHTLPMPVDDSVLRATRSRSRPVVPTPPRRRGAWRVAHSGTAMQAVSRDVRYAFAWGPSVHANDEGWTRYGGGGRVFGSRWRGCHCWRYWVLAASVRGRCSLRGP